MGTFVADDERYGARPSPEVETVGLEDEVPAGTEWRTWSRIYIREGRTYALNHRLDIGACQSILVPEGTSSTSPVFQCRVTVERASVHRWPPNLTMGGLPALPRSSIAANAPKQPWFLPDQFIDTIISGRSARGGRLIVA
jgi:hypothetical protein